MFMINPLKGEGTIDLNAMGVFGFVPPHRLDLGLNESIERAESNFWLVTIVFKDRVDEFWVYEDRPMELLEGMVETMHPKDDWVSVRVIPMIGQIMLN